MKPKNKKTFQPSINEVAKDIIGLKFKKNHTLKQCQDMFHAVMRKHNIKEGTPSFNEEGKEIGRIVANFEWTICKTLFHQKLHDFFTWEGIIGNVPKDLQK